MIDVTREASFIWDFGRHFLLEQDGSFYVWSDPDYGGDNTIRPYSNPAEFIAPGLYGRDKGTHIVARYCGPDVILLEE